MGYTVSTSYPSPPSSTTGPLIDLSTHNNLQDIELNGNSKANPPPPPLSARFKHVICKILFSIIHTISLPGTLAAKHLRPSSFRSNKHHPPAIDEPTISGFQEQIIYIICKECGGKRRRSQQREEKTIGDPVRYFYEDEKERAMGRGQDQEHSLGLIQTGVVDVESSPTLSLASTLGGGYSPAPQQGDGSSPTIGTVLTWGRYPLTKERNAYRSVVG